MRLLLISASAVGLIMTAAMEVQADNAHYNDPSSICFRACMQKPPNCWVNDTQTVCPKMEKTCAKKCNYSLN
jgi:hypothetical protein